MKIFKAPLEKMKLLFSNYSRLKKALAECQEHNKWLNQQIDKYNKEYGINE